MDLNTGVRLLRLLPTRPDNAVTVHQISEMWVRNGGKPMTTRAFQRYVKVLSDGDDFDVPPLLCKVPRGKEFAYYLDSSHVANWFVTEEAALELQLSRDVLGRAFGSEFGSSAAKLADMADKISEASPEIQRIRRSIYISQDGIGRLPARIEKDVLRNVLKAIAQGKQLFFTYINSQKKCSQKLVTPLGLVAKDGTLYLVGVQGLSDNPIHYPLHRISEMQVHYKPAIHRIGFDLKRYVYDSHQFSHTLYEEEAPIALELRVHPDAIYHFEERPLSLDQTIQAPIAKESWYVVKAKIPFTVLLIPFILSMGQWIEVVGPKHVRSETVSRIRGMLERYAFD